MEKLLDGKVNEIELTVTTHRPKEITKEADTAKKGWRHYGGIIFGGTASLFYTLCTLTLKVLAGKYHPVTISLWRFLGTLVPDIFIATYFQCKKESSHICSTTWPLNNRERISNFALSQVSL